MIDIETRLDNSSIDQEVSKASGGKATVDRATDNLLAFKYSDKPAEEEKKGGWWPF